MKLSNQLHHTITFTQIESIISDARLASESESSEVAVSPFTVGTLKDKIWTLAYLDAQKEHCDVQ